MKSSVYNMESGLAQGYCMYREQFDRWIWILGDEERHYLLSHECMPDYDLQYTVQG